MPCGKVGPAVRGAACDAPVVEPRVDSPPWTPDRPRHPTTTSTAPSVPCCPAWNASCASRAPTRPVRVQQWRPALDGAAAGRGGRTRRGPRGARGPGGRQRAARRTPGLQRLGHHMPHGRGCSGRPGRRPSRSPSAGGPPPATSWTTSPCAGSSSCWGSRPRSRAPSPPAARPRTSWAWAPRASTQGSAWGLTRHGTATRDSWSRASTAPPRPTTWSGARWACWGLAVGRCARFPGPERHHRPGAPPGGPGRGRGGRPDAGLHRGLRGGREHRPCRPHRRAVADRP